MSYMKGEFDRILKSYGHKVYLQRRVRASGTGDGTWKKELEIHLTRHRSGSSVQGAASEAMEGMLSTSERIYYFRNEVQPFDGDRIYETDPRVQRPVDKTVWEIDAVVPMRGLGGDIEYYIAGCTRIRPN